VIVIVAGILGDLGILALALVPNRRLLDQPGGCPS
jgi:hypothetical protein